MPLVGLHPYQRGRRAFFKSRRFRRRDAADDEGDGLHKRSACRIRFVECRKDCGIVSTLVNVRDHAHHSRRVTLPLNECLAERILVRPTLWANVSLTITALLDLGVLS